MKMKKLINVSIFGSRKDNLKDPKTCTIEEFKTCEIYRENAIQTKNANLKPCLTCEKYERMRAEFVSAHPARICDECGKEFFLCNEKENRKTCFPCSGRKAKYAKKSTFNETKSRKNMRKTCMCVETGEIFPSAMAAANKYDIAPSAISKSARTGKTTGGFTWKYI